MIYFFLFFLSFALTYLIIKIAIKKNMIAVPNMRSSHEVPTPHGGGIGIVTVWTLGLIYLYFYNLIDLKLFYAFMVGLLVSIISFLDDIYDLSVKIRLTFQALVSLLGLYFLGGLQEINFGFFIIDNFFLINIIAFFMIIWFINLYNFLDGIDGYAGSEAVFLSVCGFIFFQNQIFLVLLVSALGFLYWNWHKARIFMGDVGSTLLGYNVAIITIYFQNMGTSLFVWLILFSLFWFDATITLFRRWNNNEQIQMSHKKHAYQRLYQSGFTHDKIVYFSMGLNILLCILAYLSFCFKSFIMLFFLLSIILMYIVVKFVDKRKSFI